MSVQRNALPIADITSNNSNNTSQDSFFVAIIRPRQPSDTAGIDKDLWIKEIWLHGDGTSYFSVPVARASNIIIINKEDRKIRRQKQARSTRNRKNAIVRKGTQKPRKSKRQLVKKTLRDNKNNIKKKNDNHILKETDNECLVMKENEQQSFKNEAEILENVTERENLVLANIENERCETRRVGVGLEHQNETALLEKDLECGHTESKNVDDERTRTKSPCSAKRILLVTAGIALASLGYFVFFRK